MMKSTSLKRVRISLVVLFVLLVYTLATGFGGCFCDKPGEDPEKDSLKDVAPVTISEEAASVWKVTFEGNPPYTGFGLLNDAPMYLFADNTVAAHNSQPISEGDKTGTQEYNLAGNYDPKANTITGTIGITRNDHSDAGNMTLRFTGTLTIPDWGGEFVGTATGTQVWSYDHPLYDDDGKVKFKAGEQLTKDFTWKVTGDMLRYQEPNEGQ
jgi:hypothetical protein